MGGIAGRRRRGHRAGHHGVGDGGARGERGPGEHEHPGEGERERAADGGCGHGDSFVGPDGGGGRSAA